MWLNFLGTIVSFLYVQILDFLENHADRPDQKTPDWFAMKSKTIGGSEIKIFMSKNWQRSTLPLMSKKLGLNTVNYDITPCHWGNLFESITERTVEITLNCRLVGADSNIVAPYSTGLHEYHANSPDGLGVVSYYLYDGIWKLLTTDVETQMQAYYCEIKTYNVDFEFKSPISRIPTDEIPKMYLPQLWSGMECIPIVEFALFGDVVYRKCAFDDLGNNPIYDLEYHKSDLRDEFAETASGSTKRVFTRPTWTYPTAWGLTAIYAPMKNCPPGKIITGSTFDNQVVHKPPKAAKINFEDIMSGRYRAPIDPRTEAHALFSAAAESALAPPNVTEVTTGANPSRREAPSAPYANASIDFGDCDRYIFEKALNFTDKKMFIHRHTDPCFSDGRGFTKLLTDEGRDNMIDQFRKETPDGYFLLGYIPWKIMDVRYIAEDRNPDFFPLVAPRIKEFCTNLERIRASKNPRQAFYNFQAEITGVTQDDEVKSLEEMIYG